MIVYKARGADEIREKLVRPRADQSGRFAARFNLFDRLQQHLADANDDDVRRAEMLAGAILDGPLCLYGESVLRRKIVAHSRITDAFFLRLAILEITVLLSADVTHVWRDIGSTEVA